MGTAQVQRCAEEADALVDQIVEARHA
jgi:hypothetical protein